MEEPQENLQEKKQDDIAVNICKDDLKNSDHGEIPEQDISSDTFITSNESNSHKDNNVPETNDGGKNNDHQKLNDSLKSRNSSGSDEKQEEIVKKNNEGKFLSILSSCEV